MCRWCGTRYCAECLRGDFTGEMREPDRCKVCNQVCAAKVRKRSVRVWESKLRFALHLPLHSSIQTIHFLCESRLSRSEAETFRKGEKDIILWKRTRVEVNANGRDVDVGGWLEESWLEYKSTGAVKQGVITRNTGAVKRGCRWDWKRSLWLGPSMSRFKLVRGLQQQQQHYSYINLLKNISNAFRSGIMSVRWK